MKEETKYPFECSHEYAPLGFQKVSSDETKIEVVAAVFCVRCSMFRTKILYFDRQKINKSDTNS